METVDEGSTTDTETHSEPKEGKMLGLLEKTNPQRFLVQLALQLLLVAILPGVALCPSHREKAKRAALVATAGGSLTNSSSNSHKVYEEYAHVNKKDRSDEGSHVNVLQHPVVGCN